MTQESVEKRSEFRFPVVLPVEYFTPDNSHILSYALDLSGKGTFISSDDPLVLGSRFDMQLTIPFDYESSKIFRTQGTVTWNRMQPFKSKTNGMGVNFIEPFSEDLLLYALADNVRKLVKQTEAKGLLGGRVEKLESELEETRTLTALGRCVEKILLELSNPIFTLSGELAILKRKMDKHKRMLEDHEETNKEEFRKMITEFNDCRNKIDQILNEYKIISELAHMAGDDRETLERKLKRYNC